MKSFLSKQKGGEKHLEVTDGTKFLEDKI